MNTLSLALFACAGLMVVVSLSSMYATNVTFWKGRTSPWAVFLGAAALLVLAAALMIGP
ncbi:hypothetical protein GCM10023160_26200 [Brachybacterium paraconglomeratum]|uniref:hypothetical protein n=1 Tax=Brachybacterium paraconglomeratum TaxID=173362 RepID=UPI0031E94836